MVHQDIQLDCEFKTKGEWWLPGLEEHSISGILSYHPDTGLKLETLGAFSKDLGEIVRSSQEQSPIILGRSEDGTEITLHRCQPSNLSIYFNGGYPSLIYQVQEGFFGKHFEHSDDLIFHSASFSATYLEPWLGAIPIKRKLSTDNSEQGINLTFQPPQHFRTYIKEIDSYIESNHELKTKSDSNGSFDLTWTYQALLSVKPVNPRDFQWFQEQLSSLTNLISLLSGQRTYFRSLRLFHGPEETWTVFVIFPQPSEIVKKGLSSSSLLIPFVNISNQLEQTIGAWFRDSIELGPVHDLFFSVFYKPELYVQSQLLHLMQALETFHRRTQGGQYLSNEQFNGVAAALKSAIPSWVTGDFRNVLSARLGFQNDLSLRSRITALVNDLPKELLGGLIGEPKVFIKGVCNTRDYLTHYSKESPLPDTRATAQIYHRFVSQLLMMLTYHLLRRIEIAENIACSGLAQKFYFLKKIERNEPDVPVPEEK